MCSVVCLQWKAEQDFVYIKRYPHFHYFLRVSSPAPFWRNRRKQPRRFFRVEFLTSVEVGGLRSPRDVEPAVRES